MNKLIGVLVLFVAMSTTSLNANTNVTVEDVGVGHCFGVRNQTMNDALANNWEYWQAWDLASAAFNACISANQ